MLPDCEIGIASFVHTEFVNHYITVLQRFTLRFQAPPPPPPPRKSHGCRSIDMTMIMMIYAYVKEFDNRLTLHHIILLQVKGFVLIED